MFLKTKNIKIISTTIKVLLFSTFVYCLLCTLLNIRIDLRVIGYSLATLFVFTYVVAVFIAASEIHSKVNELQEIKSFSIPIIMIINILVLLSSVTLGIILSVYGFAGGVLEMFGMFNGDDEDDEENDDENE